jgi:hypothetical protein
METTTRLILACSLLIASCAETCSEALVLRRLTIQDAAGRPRIELAGDGSGAPSIRLLDERGAVRLRITARAEEEGGVVIELCGPGEGDPALELGQNRKAAGVSLFGEGHTRRAALAAGEGGSILSMNGGDGGSNVINLRCGADRGSVEVLGVGGEREVQGATVEVNKDAASIRIEEGGRVTWHVPKD